MEKLPTLDWKIGTDELWCFSNVSLHTLTHATSDLGNWFNGKIGFVFGSFGLSEN
jgi:hypothetical protein